MENFNVIYRSISTCLRSFKSFWASLFRFLGHSEFLRKWKQCYKSGTEHSHGTPLQVFVSPVLWMEALLLLRKTPCLCFRQLVFFSACSAIILPSGGFAPIWCLHPEFVLTDFWVLPAIFLVDIRFQCSTLNGRYLPCVHFTQALLCKCFFHSRKEPRYHQGIF